MLSYEERAVFEGSAEVRKNIANLEPARGFQGPGLAIPHIVQVNVGKSVENIKGGVLPVVVFLWSSP